MYNQISRWYQWKKIYNNIIKYVKSCKEYQQQTRIHYKKSLYSIWNIIIWEKIDVNVVYMSNSIEYGYIIFAWDDLSGWVEEWALVRAISKNITKFIYKEIICCHDCSKYIVMN